MKRLTKMLAVMGMAGMMAAGTAFTGMAAVTTDVSVVSKGADRVGWIQVQNKWYYFDAAGNPVQNQWVQDGDNLYWMKDNGEMAKQSWVEFNGTWFWVNAQGALAKNIWVQDGDSWYYMGNDGLMMKNTWLDLDGKRYFLNENGIAVTGWKEIGGNYYFFNSSDCSMAKDTMVGDYRVDANGVWVQ